MAKAQPRIILIMTVFISIASISGLHFPLERRAHLDGPDQIKKSIMADRMRHSQRFNLNGGAVVDFPVQGCFDTGLIYTAKLRFGTPMTEETMLVDTGSEITWVTCVNCGKKCTRSPDSIGGFDPKKSYTAKELLDILSIPYADESTSSGYLVQDELHLDVRTNQTTVTNTSARVNFGCSTRQTGSLVWLKKPMDGILGLGPGNLSVLSQLSAMNVTSNVFSHCFKGDGSGGGSLIFGEVTEPGFAYTPIVSSLSQLHYHVILRRIAVNGRDLQINPSVFEESTFIDSGTHLAYLPTEAYHYFVSAITSAVSPSASPFSLDDIQCYILPKGTTNSIFPQISFNFEGNALMIVKPKQYLLDYGAYNTSTGERSWCLAFQESLTNSTVLGVAVLRDKKIVYEKDKIGFKEDECSGESTSGSNPQVLFSVVLPLCFVVLVVLIALFVMYYYYYYFLR